jgi:hypothetical protein
MQPPCARLVRIMSPTILPRPRRPLRSHDRQRAPLKTRVQKGFKMGPRAKTLAEFWRSHDPRALVCISAGPSRLKFRVDRILVLCLPRLAVLVSIEADRPGAWLPGPMGPFQNWFPGLQLSRDFERVKVPGNPMKSPFCFGIFWGSNSCDNYLRK